uniref:Uncharacterized protein n=1 Tax=Octopus bimaculoides TaxID=37653 RepID=A0A0L8HVX9_OCTBM
MCFSFTHLVFIPLPSTSYTTPVHLPVHMPTSTLVHMSPCKFIHVSICHFSISIVSISLNVQYPKTRVHLIVTFTV